MTPRTRAGLVVVVAGVLVAAFALIAHHRTPVQTAQAARSAQAPLSASAARPGDTIVALGDSVAAGSACACTSFPELVRDAVTSRTGVTAQLRNAASDGVTSSDMLASLTTDDALIAAVRQATLVTITVGANDFSEQLAGACDAELRCYDGAVAGLSRTMDAALARVVDLSQGRARVVVTGYWGVFLDGQQGAANGQRYVTTARALTLRVNALLRSSAEAHKVLYADLDGAFTAAAGTDRTSLLADDGDHPNAGGHRVIAAAVLAACACG